MTKDWHQDNQRQAVLLGYMAGIIDGEGCIRLGRNKGNGQYQMMIQVGMVELHAISLLQETFGGNIREERVPNRRSIYRWVLGKREEVINFIEVMEPLLLIKQPQLQVLKKWLLEPLRGGQGRVKPLSPEELQRREALFLEMKKLNAVGAAATTNRNDTSNSEVIV